MLIMLSYFVNLVLFFLILKVFTLLSMIIKKNSQNEMGEIEFLHFYLNLRVCIMLIEVDELLKLLLNSTLFLPL